LVLGIFLMPPLTGRLAAQAYAPVVHFSVTLPSGQTQSLSAPESGLARATAAGAEYAFRPTMIDDAGQDVVVTIFDLGNATTAVRELGSVEVRKGGAAVTSKTTPAFKVQLTDVTRTTT
jgi:hypothetical protein